LRPAQRLDKFAGSPSAWSIMRIGEGRAAGGNSRTASIIYRGYLVFQTYFSDKQHRDLF
jgi:hypothetical protein